jgi:hypothetical protein
MQRGAASIALATSLLLVVAPSPPARAQDAAGAVYEGTHEAGGPVRLVVADEPARIVGFDIEGVAGGGCSWGTITLENWDREVAVVDGRFEAANADGDRLEGAQLGETAAERRFEGTIQVRDPIKGCETPPLRWVAAVAPAP